MGSVGRQKAIMLSDRERAVKRVRAAMRTHELLRSHYVH